MRKSEPESQQAIETCVDSILEKLDYKVTLGLPLGLGKPVYLANALYRRAQADSRVELHIITAISLVVPTAKPGLEQRFLQPFVDRVFSGVPELLYAKDALTGSLPPNVKLSEFFFKAGSQLNNPSQQQNYICSNYTHAVRDILALGMNLVGQMVAPGSDPDKVSLSSNPDLSLDLVRHLKAKRERGEAVMAVAEVNSRLPYMPGHAEVEIAEFDHVIEPQSGGYELFSAPQMEVSPSDHMIGFYASTLLKDGGTLQVGIGSLGTAVIHSAILKHKNNAIWQSLFDHLDVASRFPIVDAVGDRGIFEAGLYGCSEMLVDGFIHLLHADILKRPVYDHVGLQRLINAGRVTSDISLSTLDELARESIIRSPLRGRDVEWLKRYGIFREQVSFRGGRLVLDDHNVEPDLANADARKWIGEYALGSKLSGGVVAHGGFFLGPRDFYQALRDLSEEQRASISMTSVNYINDLYDHMYGNQSLKASQRSHARLINSCMMQTLSGAAVSDGLDDGRVVSGVGGQYNFVAMAHDLEDARSIMTLRATRESKGEVKSNIVFNYAHCTIPRHLRDIVITEYGIADLRGRSDEDVALALIRIADSRFQPSLLEQVKKAGKVRQDFELPAAWKNNTPEAVDEALATAGDQTFPPYPFGSDFTEVEQDLARALTRLKDDTASRRGKLGAVFNAMGEAYDPQTREGEVLKPYLERMGLLDTSGFKEKLQQRLLIHALQETLPELQALSTEGAA